MYKKHMSKIIDRTRALSLVVLPLLIGCSESADAPDPPLPTPNAAPQVSSAATASVDERTTDVFYTATANDADGDSVSFSIAGDDAGFFTFDTTTGELAFSGAADFEIPEDTNADNVYDLVLTASDGISQTSIDLAVTVNDVTNIPIRVSRIALGFDLPIYATHAGDGSNRLFVVEQRGLIKIVDLDDNSVLQDPFLDISADLSTGFEQGLLGLAFAPDYATSGLFYVYTTNLNGDTEVLEFTVSSTNPNIAAPLSERLILTFPQPFANHNSGWIDFGPDGNLYISSGDGGGSGDPQNNSQNTSNLLGNILRINPFVDDFPSDDDANYGIPIDNPFINQAGADEIFAYGLRNPFRASFDRATGDLYIGDVGQNEIEEIDLISNGTSGQNFGWNILEGTQDFNGFDATGLTPPIAEYPHEPGPIGGFSVTGGYVHRGSVEALFGQYVFADFASNNVWSIPVDTIAQGTTISSDQFIIRTEDITMPDLGAINAIPSFGEDENGELYLFELFRGELFRVENDE